MRQACRSGSPVPEGRWRGRSAADRDGVKDGGWRRWGYSCLFLEAADKERGKMEEAVGVFLRVGSEGVKEKAVMR